MALAEAAAEAASVAAAEAADEVDSLLLELLHAATSRDAAARPATAPYSFLDMRCCPFPAGASCELCVGV
jgi:hypothetical protein